MKYVAVAAAAAAAVVVFVRRIYINFDFFRAVLSNRSIRIFSHMFDISLSTSEESD